jgi:hypothetical protein
MMKKTVTSLKLAVMLLAINIIVSVVSFTSYTNNQQVYAQSIDDDANLMMIMVIQ